MARRLVPIGRIQTAGDTSLALLIANPSSSRNAVDARIRAVTPAIVGDLPQVAAAAASAVEGALVDASLVKSTAVSERGVQYKWGVQADGFPSSFPANDQFPAKSAFEVTRTLPTLNSSGKLDPSVLPPSEDGTDLTAELELVSSRGRPSYAPSSGTYDATLNLFNFRPSQMLPWMLAREKARRGRGNAVILSLGTSISRVVGDLQSGETFPEDAWPGQMLSRLGLPVGGSGIRHMSIDIPVTSHVGGFAEPTITVANPDTSTNKVETVALGFAQSSMVKITDSGTKTAYVEFNTAAGSYTELWIRGQEITGTSVVTIDGVDRTWAGSTAVSGADIPALAGYASGQRISKVTLTAGTHTVRVHGTTAGVVFGGFEGRNSSGVVLHRGAIAGKSQLGFMNTTGNLDGLAWAIDPWGAHLVIDELHINDWQNHYDVAGFKAQKIELWSRARSRGASVLSVIAPTPDLEMYPTSGGNNPPITEYIAAVYAAAVASDVPVLDLSYRWGAYAPSAGFYPATGDHIHPNSLGLSDIAGTVAKILQS